MKLYHKTSSVPKESTRTLTLSPSDLQATIDLQEIAIFLLNDTGLPAGNALNFIIPQFDPDNPEHHIFKSYWRNPNSGNRGGAIKFIQKMRRCSYERAVGYLEGWTERSQYRPDDTTFIEPVKLQPKPIQLQLALDSLPRRKAVK